MRVTLTVTQGPHQGRSFSFAEHDTFLVGRAPEARFCLPDRDKYFSRLHFLVEINPPLCRVQDMNSHNGTYVNGQRVQSADLRDGDEIRAGHTVLRVSIEGAERAVADDTVSAPPAEPVRTAAWVVPTLAVGRPLPPDSSAADSNWPPIPGYRIVDELGRGGMGVVYRAERLSDGSVVALKTILPAVAPTPELVGRFLREANTLKALEHPHIVSFREMGEAGGLLYFAMDFVPGMDAKRLLNQEGPLPVGRAVRLTCQLLEALAYAHGRGFVHRDIKPGNLLLTEVEGRETARLADFGLARAYQASRLSGLTVTGSIVGTPLFMAPEQVLDFRVVKPPADQYAAAATLYNLLTGAYVYDPTDTAMELYLKIVQDNPVPIQSRRPGIPIGLAQAIHHALERRPEERFPDAGALRQALLPFCGK
jgi:serine/threonine-protein kinase